MFVPFSLISFVEIYLKYIFVIIYTQLIYHKYEHNLFSVTVTYYNSST